ncbi:hypothetical protein BD410DRAFT_820220 [Rickenella mellea]|uniref:PHD-type domain-containing protein n=1 Tax=Rickenella mellea TaxID=50990 RepID=A0A4Y7QD83_9AGAM|nr:hypothetical protein BD410DRAFT_820220 [Rickenella mellea]
MASTTSVPTFLLEGVTVPVFHPPHLEGDPSLATEILPGPPPLTSVRLPKRVDSKRPLVPSYLPVSDPGTTYGLAGSMALAQGPAEDGARRKRARVDKSSAYRTHRPSARILANHVSSMAEDTTHDNSFASSSQIAPEFFPIPLDDDDNLSVSRSASSQNVPESSNTSANGRTKRTTHNKGKGKERDSDMVVRVKEEPVTLQLSDLPPISAPANEDHCTSCTSLGALVYCDGCPRAFHLWCLDPPMEATDLPEGEDRWYCPQCKAAQAPLPKLTPSFLSPLVQHLQTKPPTEFQLPEDIRSFFKGVATDSRGAYFDNSNFKPPRVGRHGFGEERDPYRLKDSKGGPAMCYRCGKSALPNELTTSGRPEKRARRSLTMAREQWKAIIPCDYCSLHWHLDCLDPPLTTLPPFGKKWKCPNHACNVAPKRRVPKTSSHPIEVTEPGQINNGVIEVINSDATANSKVVADEVLINGRRYRVPERVIVLDFWSKVKQHKLHGQVRHETASTASSPLTSLSSLGESQEADSPPPMEFSHHPLTDDTLAVAQLLCNMRMHPLLGTRHKEPAPRKVEAGTQTEPDHSVRLEREDTEHLSGLMKAALKDVNPSVSKVEHNGDKEHSLFSAKPPRSVKNTTSSTPTRKRKPTVNGKVPRTPRSKGEATAGPSTGSRNGNHIPGGRTPIRAASPPKHVTPNASSLSDAESKPQVHSLKIRIPRLSTLNHSANHSTPTSSTTPAVQKSSVISSGAFSPPKGRPRRSVRRRPSASGSSADQSLTISAPSASIGRSVNSRTSSSDVVT